MLPGEPDACETAAGYYEKYARLCVKDTALVDGRVAYERGNVRRRLGLSLAGNGLQITGVALLLLLVGVSLLLLLSVVVVWWCTCW